MPKGNRTIIKSQEKLQLKKYDPRIRKHVLFVEGKP